MKSYIRILFLACLIAGIFAFQTNKRQTNAFSYKGKIHSVQHAYVDQFQNQGGATVGYNIYLGSMGSYNNSSSLDYINLNINSNGQQGITPGVYHFSRDNGEMPFTFSKGKVLIGLDQEQAEKNLFYTTEGTVKVSKWGEKHIIEYQLKLNNGEKLNGVFRGKIEQRTKPS